MNQLKHRPSGMLGFSVVWLGQLVSMTGSGMTRFALTIWVWQQTGEATALALVAIFSFAPAIIFSPIAGAIVDRVSRKKVMIASDLAAGLSTVALLILYSTGLLEIWHLWAAGFFASTFESFQFPAYSAAITTMIDKKHYTRANAMLTMVESASGIIAPASAGALLPLLGISGIMIIDIVTFVFAIGALLLVVIPDPVQTATGRASRGTLFQESLFGFRYIFANPSLLGLLLIFFSTNLTFGLVMILFAPMILARTADNTVILGTTMMMFGVGGVVGGLVIAAWGGFKRRIHGVLLWPNPDECLRTDRHRSGPEHPRVGTRRISGDVLPAAGSGLKPGYLAGESLPRYPGEGVRYPAPHCTNQFTCGHDLGRAPGGCRL